MGQRALRPINNWTVHFVGLLFKTRLLFESARTKEHAVLQLQARRTGRAHSEFAGTD